MPTEQTGIAMPATTENYDLIRAARRGIEPAAVAEGLYLVRHDDGSPEIVDVRDRLHDELALDRPHRKTGEFIVTDVASFAGYLDKHGLPETELWGHQEAGRVRAVINANCASGDTTEGDTTEGDAGWGDHEVWLSLQHSTDWSEWLLASGKYLPQDEFAEFIEDHLPNFGDPTGADMLELARSFKATQRVEFGSEKHAGGQTTIAYTETTEAKAGRKGAVEFPDRVRLGIRVYEGGRAYEVGARIRYRIREGSLVIGFKLDRPRDVIREAFDDVVDEIEGETGRTVWQTE